jgi:hypothetical protein
MASAVVSGSVRITNVSNVINPTFSALVTVSQWATHAIVLPDATDDFVFSSVHFSNPGFLLMYSTGIVRMQQGGLPSAASYASNGMEFKDLFAQIGSGISGPINMHFANSSGNSATVTIVIGQ